MIRIPKFALSFFLTSLFLILLVYSFLNQNLNQLKRDHTRSWLTSFNDHDLLHGNVIMPTLTNETTKAEVGRASWKLLHTMAARFPIKPTPSEREAFSSFLYLFSRMYPCGECSLHFQTLLKSYPPQTSSRTAASLHLCFLHNKVNEKLNKEEFNCNTSLEGLYDCGCGNEDDSSTSSTSSSSKDKDKDVGKEKGKGELIADFNEEPGKMNREKLNFEVVLERGEEEKKEKIDPITGNELIGG